MFFLDEYLKSSIIKNFYYNALHYACLSENFDLVKYLISLGKIDINSKDIFFITFSNDIFFFL